MIIRPATAADVPSVIPMVAKTNALHESWDPAKFGFKKNVIDKYRSWMISRSDDPPVNDGLSYAP